MTIPLFQRASLALLPLVAVAPSAVEGPGYAPAAGTSLSKSFVLTIETSVDSSDTLINGDDSMAPEVEADTSVVRTVTVTDTVAACADGRPTSLLRTYDGLSMEIESPVKISMAGQDMEADMAFEGTSPLDSQGVTFTWDGDADEYTRAWTDEGAEGDNELLEGIAEDLDLRAFLPDSDVSPGDSWEVDPNAFVEILFAGGDLAFELNSTGDEPIQGMGDPSEQPEARESWRNLTDASVTATLGEQEGDGDQRIAVIQFEVDIAAAKDDTETLMETLGNQVPDGADINIDLATTESFLEGKGILKWNQTAGHALSLTFTGDVSAEQEQNAGISMGGQEFNMESVTATSGTLNLEVTISAN